MSYEDEILELLGPEEMDLEFLLDSDSGSPPRSKARIEELTDLSTYSRNLAQLPNQSQMSRSLAVVPLSNMSAVSHNLANVGALPQCNQRHSISVAPVAIAESVDDDYSTVTEGTTLRKSRKKSSDQEKLEARRVKNRQAAERMRRRRSEEALQLKNKVKELEALVQTLQARLEASEAQNSNLQAILRSSLERSTHLPVASLTSNTLPEHIKAEDQEYNNNNEAAKLCHTTFIAPILAQNDQVVHSASPTTAVSFKEHTSHSAYPTAALF